MNVIRLLVVIAVAGGGYAYVHAHRANVAVVQSGPGVSVYGFASLPPVDGQGANTVFVVAAENCPHEEAQRADRLAKDLSEKGIPVQRSHEVHFNFTSPPDSSVLERMKSIMEGPLPIVFINGKAKSNPSLEEVVAEFNIGK